MLPQEMVHWLLFLDQVLYKMAAIFRNLDLSTGADGGAATALTTCSATTSYFNGKLVALVGDQFDPHTVGLVTHAGGNRQITVGSTTMFFEGISVVRAGDPIADGDVCGTGSNNSFSG